MEEPVLRETLVLATSSRGTDVRGTPVRLARYGMVFESYSLGGALQTSEVLKDFRIALDDRTLYSGRAVVKALVDAGPTFLCEVELEDSWTEPPMLYQNGHLAEEFDRFFDRWQKH